MSFLTSPIRSAAIIAATLAISASATLGVASASAKTEGKSHAHHVAKAHAKADHAKRSLRHAKKHHAKKHHAKKHHARKHHAKKARSAKRNVAWRTSTTTKTTATTTKTTTTKTTTTPATTTSTTPPTTTVTSSSSSSTAPTGVPGTWNMVLDSEFNGSSLPADWRTGWFGTGVTSPINSGEAACYSPSNVTFPGDGTMHLNLTTTSSSCGGLTKADTGAIVTTNPDDGRPAGTGFQYTYGVLEARVYVPAVGSDIANWPAVWTDGQSWPNDGEDDIMEGLSGQACWHFHDPLGGPGGCSTTITPGWHTFASNWQPGSVTYYYDGKNVGSISTGITSAPMYAVLDNTVASADPTPTAAAMQVQYVRVWQS